MTSLASALPIQLAVLDRLTGDAEYMALVAGVHDYVPEDAAYPYTVVGDVIETPDNTHDHNGREAVIGLHHWSRYRGYRQVLEIGARATALLDHQPLAVGGLLHVVTRFEFEQTLTDPAPPGDIRHLVQRFRVVTEQAGT